MMITVQYAADKKLAPAKTQICKWAEQALAGHTDKTDVTIRIVDSNEMATLNSTYRKKSGPTNVLSFPIDLPDEVLSTCPFLGDIVICAEVVNREAAEQHKSQQSHWAHMVVHGIFHLLGYDHEKDDEADKMEAMEIAVMRKLGFANPYEDGEHIKHHE
jgi:probable rRNA maturation factor